MRRIVITMLFGLSYHSGFADNLQDVLQSIYYQQSYCIKTTPPSSIAFLKQNTDYSANFCEHIQEFEPGETSNQYNQLLNDAETNPKKYGYMIALANMTGVGTFGSNKIAEKWLQKSIEAGSSKAKLVYASFLMSHVTTNECDTAEKSYKCDAKARNILANIDFSKTNTMLTGFYPGNKKEACKIVTRAVKNGMLNSYPVYLSCITEDFKKPLTNNMKQKLNEVISNKETSITAKKQAAKILENKHDYDLLNAIR